MRFDTTPGWMTFHNMQFTTRHWLRLCCVVMPPQEKNRETLRQLWWVFLTLLPSNCTFCLSGGVGNVWFYFSAKKASITDWLDYQAHSGGLTYSLSTKFWSDTAFSSLEQKVIHSLFWKLEPFRDDHHISRSIDFQHKQFTIWIDQKPLTIDWLLKNEMTSMNLSWLCACRCDLLIWHTVS